MPFLKLPPGAFAMARTFPVNPSRSLTVKKGRGVIGTDGVGWYGGW